jgi:glycosidase
LHAFNFTIPGIPVIYYGDEIGMPGGNDPDNRRQMSFNNLDSMQINLKAQVAKLAELRKNNMALIYGDIKIIEADEYTLMYERRYFDQRVVVMINNVSRPKSMMAPDAEDMQINFGSKKTTGNGFAVVTVKPHGFEILTN